MPIPRNSENFANCKARVCVLEEFMIMIALWKEPIHSKTMPGKILRIVGHDPRDSKSNVLHVDIFRFCFIHLRYILLYIPVKESIILLKSRTSTSYFSHSTSTSVTNRRFFPSHVLDELTMKFEMNLMCHDMNLS